MKGIGLPNFKSYYVVTTINTVYYWQRNIHTDQWNRMKNPETDPYKNAQLISFTKVHKQFNRGKMALKKMVVEQWDIHREKMNLNLGITTYKPKMDYRHKCKMKLCKM